MNAGTICQKLLPKVVLKEPHPNDLWFCFLSLCESVWVCGKYQQYKKIMNY